MNVSKITFYATLIAFCCTAYCSHAQQLLSSSRADTWTATDALGRTLPAGEEAGGIRKDRYVGIFYFIWHGAHGYDTHGGERADEGVMEKSPGDTLSPYDITKLLKADPENPQYGPEHAWHYWAEPYFGYYLPDDEWIIRKHAQMLSDAGVDVIVLDVTNAAIYLPQVTKIADTYMEMRENGLSTPSIAFLTNTAAARTVQRLYENIYSKGLFKELWFNWKGKPLLLCPPDAVTEETARFFTTRQSWAWSKGQEWFGNGKDKWPWLDHTPQAYGWHESPEKPEEVSVNIAQHPVSNIGRSFHDGRQPGPDGLRSGEGLNFAEQWERALELDPEFIFITGWNEWVAMRFTDGSAKEFLGKPITKGDTYFVDLYNAEYSRDAEPMKDGYGDNYYYQMIDGIRRFKGARTVTAAKTGLTVRIDGDFAEWEKAAPVFRDDEGDTFHRDHPGWGRIEKYENRTGRNDIVEARVATGEEHISFYVRTAEALSSWKEEYWMHLLITATPLKADVKGKAERDQEGSLFLVNRERNEHTATLEALKDGGGRINIADIRYAAGATELELQIPKKHLGITADNFRIEFKWLDNVSPDADPINWLDKGDAAPNARFRYLYIFDP